MNRRSLLKNSASAALVALCAARSVLPLAPAQAAEAPIAKEKNPPGDIPDDQVFVAFSSPLGFSLKVPEGWGRTNAADGVTFADTYGQVVVAVKAAGAPPTLASVRASEVPELQKTGHAVKVSAVTEVRLPSGPAIRIAYASNSEPNAVTGKQIRLENERFLIGHADQQAALTFSAPAGADNADQWILMSQSFAWK